MSIRAIARAALVAALVGSSLIYAPMARAANYAVTTNADASDENTGDGVCEATDGQGDCTLRAAIQQSNATTEGDLITVPAMTITLTNGQLTINDSGGLTITGAGTSQTTVSGNNASRVFVVETATHTISNLTITGGNSGAFFGGGVFVDGGNLTLDGVVVTGNATSSTGAGGGIATEGALTVSDSGITNNTAPSAAGIYVRLDGSLVMNDNSLVDNNDTSNGGGGGIYLQTGTASIQDSTLSNNDANDTSGYGGAIYSSSTAAGTTLSLDDVEIVDNTADQLGGALYLGGGTTSIDSAEISDNTAFQGGALGVSAVINSVSLTVDESSLERNEATSTSGGPYGGAILVNEGGGYNATVSLSDSALIDNVGYSGGAVHLFSGDLNATNTTFAANKAQFFGGAINNGGDGTVDLLNVTVAENQAHTDPSAVVGSGGGLSSTGGGTTTLENSIVANNTAGSTSPQDDDCNGTITSAGHNIVEEIPAGCTFAPTTGDQTGIEPQLGPRGLNGGATHTYPLELTSPALDSANGTSCPATDQRGYPRPVDGPDAGTTAECDIGAYEALMFSSEDESITEGDPPGTTNMNFTIALAEAAPEPVAVDITLTHGTTDSSDIATCRYSGSDIPCNSLIVIPAGTTQVTFTVKIARDDIDEADESFSLTLDSTQALVEEDQVEGTITDDDGGPIGHGRSLSLNLRRHLKAKGRVTVADAFTACRQQVPVKVQKKRPGGQWKTLATVSTTNLGYYKSPIPDKEGTYRALAPKQTLTIGDQTHNCGRAKSPEKKHKH